MVRRPMCRYCGIHAGHVPKRGPMTIDAVAAYIAALREMKGVPQRAVAEAIGVSPRNITAWENSKRLPHVGTLVALVEYLGGDAVIVHQLLRDPLASTTIGRSAALHQIEAARAGLQATSELSLSAEPQLSEEELFQRWMTCAFAGEGEVAAFSSALQPSELQLLAADMKEIVRRIMRWR